MTGGPDFTHGTERGYQTHWRRGTPACDSCKQAHAAKEKNRRGGPPVARPVPACGTKAGYHRHIYLGTATCVPCRTAHAQSRRELEERNKPGKVWRTPLKTRNVTVKVPLDIFAELHHACADPATILKLDEYFGPKTVDSYLQAADKENE